MYALFAAIRIFSFLGILKCAGGNVTVFLSTDYPSDDTYYILHRKPVTLQCIFTSAAEVTWKIDENTFFVYSISNQQTVVEDGFSSKVRDSHYSADTHTVILDIDKTTDEGSTVTCVVTISPFIPAETGKKDLVNILVPPSSVTMSTGSIIDGTQTSIQCVVSSVYQGKDVTEFKLRVGDSYMTNGTKAETSGSVTGTYTVTYTQAVTFTYSSHQGLQMQCEMTWMKGTSVETNKTSEVQELDIYYKVTSVTLEVSETAVEEGSSVTFICNTSSNPSPRLRLYRQREGQSTSQVKTVTDVTLSWTKSVISSDNKVEFYCRTDDNKNIDGWNFDIQSENQQITVWYKPTLTCDSHSKPDPTEGDTRQIECTSTLANPEPVLHMYRGDMVVKTVTGRTLTYSVDITREINGVQFKCTATSSDTRKYDYSVLSEQKSYNVLFSPRNNTLNSGTTISVQNGRLETLTCTTDSSNPASVMKWKKGNDVIMNGIITNNMPGDYRSKQSESKYTFSVMPTDNGLSISCTPVWKGTDFNKLTKTATLDVLYHPESVTMSVPSSNTEGQTITVQCTATANPIPILQLYNNSKKLGHAITTNFLHLTVTVTRVMNNNNLYCIATSSDPTKFNYTINSIGTTLAVAFPPLINTLGSEASVVVKAGDELSLSCTTGSSNPMSEMVWEKDGSEETLVGTSTNGEYGGKVLSSSYAFSPQKSDNGVQVSCTPKWKENKLSALKKTVTLDILYFPSQPTLSLSTNGASEADIINVKCSSGSANPEPVLTIYKSDVKLSNAKTGNKVTHQLQVDREMNGEDLYCQATSSNEQKLGYTFTSEPKTLNVLFPPQKNTLNSNAPMPVLAGSEETLTCTTGSSNPVSVMVWRKGDTVVTSGVRNQMSDGEYGGEVLQSTYTFIAQKSDYGLLVTCTPMWEGNEYTEYRQGVSLNVRYPPLLIITGPEAPVEEGDQVTIDCKVQVGNPESITYFYWEFDPKYSNNPSQALPEQRENRELIIQRTVYTDAGTYRCFAGNAVGADTGEIQIVVHYPPQIYNEDTLLYYSALGEAVILSLTVRAFPEISDIKSAFVWSKRSRKNIVTSSKIQDEVFQTQLNIASVTGADYGEYIVAISNGISGPAIFNIELRQRGPPEAPRNVTIIALAAESVVVSWVVGLNGGSEQTFVIEFTELESSVENYIATEHVDLETDSVRASIIYGLNPKTKYQAKVRSKNLFNGGSETSSMDVFFTTREKPVVNQNDLTMEMTETSAILRWVYGRTDNDYTTVFIEQCYSKNCILHNITRNIDKVLEISLVAGKMFYLVIYQDGLVAYRSDPFKTIDENDTATIKTGGSSGGIIGGVIAAILVIAVILVVIIWFFKRRKKYQPSTTATEGHISEVPIYMNVIPKNEEKTYQDLEKTEQIDKTLYEQLSRIRLSEQFDQTEMKNYEEIRRSMHIITFKEDDIVNINDVIHDGHYCVSQKASLCTEAGRVSVLVKSCHPTMKLCQAQYLFNQVKCLEILGRHDGIVEAYSLGHSMSGPLNIKLVTKYYPSGNLKMYLGKEFCKSDNQTGLLHKLSLEIAQALAYLETVTPEILHFCLCAEHVLIDDTGSCRLTGFDFKDHVLLREIEEEEDGIYGALEWKAPETIEDCKAHTKFADVWSFGVLLFQIYTKGRKPYECMTEDEIKAFVRSGSILKMPDGCPAKMYAVMQNCWTYNADMRPAFHSLLEQIKAIQPAESRVDQVNNPIEYEPMVFN